MALDVAAPEPLGTLLRSRSRAAHRRQGRKLEGWRFHDLRHYFVTELFRRGAAAHAVQAPAGHADLATTQRYAHVAPPDLEAAITRLGARRGNSWATSGQRRPIRVDPAPVS